MASKTHWVADPDAIAALRSPVRQRLMDRLELRGPASAAELSRELGRPADRVYYHLRKLLEVGLIAEVGAKGEGRKREQLYDLANRRWHIAYDPESPELISAIDGLTAAMLREALRDFEGGWEQGGVRVRGERRNLWSLRLEARLEAKEITQLNHHLQSIVDLLRRSRGPEEVPADTKPNPAKGRSARQAVALTWVLAPIADPEIDHAETK